MNGLADTFVNNGIGVIPIEINTPFIIGSVNLYLILGEKVTLVDTGPKTELAWKSFIYHLNRNGFRIKDIDQVIVTHHHVDHSGLLSVLLEYHPKLKVYAHKKSVPWLEKNDDIVQKKYNFFEQLYLRHGLSKEQVEAVSKFNDYFNQFIEPINVDGVLEEGVTPEGLPDWMIIHNPGHSQGHISLYNLEKGLLIAGDHIIENTSPGAFIEPPFDKDGDRPKSLVDYQNSLERIKKIKIKQVFSGHGKMITTPYEVIDQQLNRIKQRVFKVREVFKDEPLSVKDIMKEVYPDRFEKFIPLYFSEILGVLDILENNNEITSIVQSGVIKYYLTGEKAVQSC
ncbi:hypothetical protein BHF71_09735 [Vulcanibacillus modesticaldus]|uniref:Metallo-beta-lactamase domain-containing protein n=1 Tax=Vulcanibacillus modesticaldus TaxID=337097 RepID=A0A1D2YU57_9BACI|nr:MBL fold metallo-hydrolase [Vulcanibacillus modesticaldus]OEF99185.1 hypothetical protein BHF71_09735 [Vulcanibacillus modesticaldus]